MSGHSFIILPAKQEYLVFKAVTGRQDKTYDFKKLILLCPIVINLTSYGYRLNVMDEKYIQLSQNFTQG